MRGSRIGVVVLAWLVIGVSYADPMVNPGFEDGTTGWTLNCTGDHYQKLSSYTSPDGYITVSPEWGSYFLRVDSPTSPSQWNNVIQDLNLQPGQTISGAWRALSFATNSSGWVFLQVNGEMLESYYTSTGSTEWNTWSWTNNTSQTTSGSVILSYLYAGSGTMAANTQDAAVFFDAPNVDPAPVSVPEPCTLLLSALCLGGLGLRRKRRPQ